MANAEVLNSFSQGTDLEQDGCISSSVSVCMNHGGLCLGISRCMLALNIKGKGWMVL